ncbi:MAG: DUF5103 domain-containing protein [Bacteroidetes bacterium]|nr:DUF5103 domain-containing protein [Bacteroidota bacterium]
MVRTPLLIFVFAFFFSFVVHAQPEAATASNVKTIRLNRAGDPISYPIVRLNSTDQLELQYDDLDGGVKNYYYTIQLCNADWKPAQLNYFDYVKGFSQVRINNYKASGISLTRYTHYQASIPDRNCQPTRSGNYLLKVFLDGDTGKLVFSKRFLVVDDKMNVAVQVTQPFNQQYFQTHHRLQVQLETTNFDIRYPQQQLQLKILQNYRWDNLISLNQPTFIRQGLLQYNNENSMLFPAGKEFRWLNLRSFRLLGDRITKQQNTNTAFELFVKEDQPRLPRQYFYYRDLNGLYVNETIDNLNPFWNADYARIHFTFKPKDGLAYAKGDLVVFGELSDYGKQADAVMKFNADRGVYEGSMFLKQGYYDYQYAIRTAENGQLLFNSMLPEQDAWETENNYMVLVYYRELGGRVDQLIALRQINSQFNRSLR